MIRKQRDSILLSAILLLAAGCGTKPASVPPPVAGSANTAAPTKAQPTEAPLTDEECVAYGKKFESLMAAGDAKGATAMIDWNAMLDEGLAGLWSNDGQTPFFLQGLHEGVIKNAALPFELLVEKTNDGGSFRFLRVLNRSEGKRVIFRYIHPLTLEFNYYEVLVSRKDGQCRGYDLYSYTTGERQSELVRRTALLHLSTKNPALKEQSSDSRANSKSSSADQAAITAMNRASNSGRHADALAAYYRLPPELQREKGILLSRLQAAMRVSKEEFIAATKDFLAAYPNDPAADIWSIHVLIANKEYEAARQAVQRIDEFVRGDATLDALRASIYLAEGNLTEADLAAQRAIATDSSLTKAWLMRVSISLEQREFGQTASILTTLQKEHGIKVQDLTTIPMYAEFVKSPEYKEWLESQSPTP